ncbi:hypothetical protein [Legionella micdadei]|uniref:hypothetical protein n=1 Tax=Legionella micdadei TaxID=451 RepID=UPI0009EF7DE1|nr:hypothetical protein [Legionella micdadei]ARH00797.1 hypothetical protein B6V88_10425 [Legionella micdadei]
MTNEYSLHKIKHVDTDEMAFSSDAKTKIRTEGVSTCIAFIVRGNFWYEDELVSFCGLYHWSGFALQTKAFPEAAMTVLKYFFRTLRNHLEVEPDEPLMLSELAFVGGERGQIDADTGKLLVSGTEKEVYYIHEAIRHFNYKKFLINIDSKNIHHHHFLTSGEQFLSITVDLGGWTYLLEEAQPELEHNTGYGDSIHSIGIK